MRSCVIDAAIALNAAVPVPKTTFRTAAASCTVATFERTQLLIDVKNSVPTLPKR